MNDQFEEMSLRAVGALSELDVGAKRREAIRSQCREVLRRRSRSRRVARGGLVARVLEPAVATTLVVLYLLGVVERTLLLLSG